ncbi:MAG: cytochrome c biogenesis protein ResB, partial [Bacilli bacterium]
MNNNCTCGHMNPEGTELCENCGIQLVNDRDVDMRYEGAARRSRMKNRSLVDRVWNFFSSVNVGLIIILLTLISSIFGTIFPQQHFISTTDPKAYYIGEYGIVGEIFYDLGFTRMYSSWWFKTILGMLAISLVIASLDRVIPLYKALKIQTVRKSIQFLSRQKIYSEWVENGSMIDSQLDKLELELKKKGYRVRKDGQALLAEKAR